MSEKKAVRAKISGRVQGVNFRMATYQVAKDHNVKGWVMNKPDGSVEALFEGDTKNVDAVLQWCHKGPSTAAVSDVQISKENYTGTHKDFSVRYT